MLVHETFAGHRPPTCFAATADKEGYHWGGGCWNNDNVDNQPNDPVTTESTHGEGGDCSGFVFKVWRLSTSGAATPWVFYDQDFNMHGPYATGDYKGAVPAAWSKLANKDYATTDIMDALVYNDGVGGHIGLIYTEGTSNGTDIIVEAKGESEGSKIVSRDYRGQSKYSAIRRTGWTS